MNIFNKGPNLEYKQYKIDNQNNVSRPLILDTFNLRLENFIYSTKNKSKLPPLEELTETETIYSPCKEVKCFKDKNEALKFCNKSIILFTKEHLPLSLYYKSKGKAKYNRVGYLKNLHITTREYSMSIIPSEFFKSASRHVFHTLSSFAKELRMNDHDQKVMNVNGWERILYRTKYGEYKPLRELFSLNCRKSIALPTSKDEIYRNEKGEYVIPAMNEHALPLSIKKEKKLKLIQEKMK